MHRARAIVMLLCTTAAWGLSFPCGKVLMAALEASLPGSDTWLFAALNIGARFGLAALILIALQPRLIFRVKEREWRQGIGLGLFGGLGLLVQADGLAHTHASTSAFLTQFTAVLVPAAVALREKTWPPLRTFGAVVMVMAGVAILGHFDWKQLRLGRGEFETLVGTGFFTAMILWLERPIFRGNDVTRVTAVMFAVVALILIPLVAIKWPATGANLGGVLTAPFLAIFLLLTILCSLVAFLWMNRWQPEVDATTAGIVYCAEPLFATVFALFMPEWLGAWVSVPYENETFTSHLIIGGGLITAANLVIAGGGQPNRTE